jgi:hypothetical protein
MWQTAIVTALLLFIGVGGYQVRKAQLQEPMQQTTSSENATGTSTGGQPSSPLGDLSVFRMISQDTLDLLNAGKQAEATMRIGDLEYEWDTAEARLKPMNPSSWKAVDGKIDIALRELRAVHPNLDGEKAALDALLGVLQ